MRETCQGRAAASARHMCEVPRGTRIIQRIKDVQRSSKGAGPVVALRSATLPARNPAIAQMKRGPRIRIAVDGVGLPSAQRADDEGKNPAHQMLDGTSHDLRTVVYDIVCRWRGGAGRRRGGKVHTRTKSWYMYIGMGGLHVHGERGHSCAGTCSQTLQAHTPPPPARAGRPMRRAPQRGEQLPTGTNALQSTEQPTLCVSPTR